MASLKWGCRGVWSIWGVWVVFRDDKRVEWEKEGTPAWDYTYDLKMHVAPLYCVVYIWEDGPCGECVVKLLSELKGWGVL